MIYAIYAVGAYALSLLVLMSMLGTRPPLPTDFVFLLVVGACPFAVAADAFGKRIRGRVAGAFCGPAVVALYDRWWMWPILALIVLQRPSANRAHWPTFLRHLPTIVFGFGTIWNLNYVLLLLQKHRLRDAWMRDLDLWLYRATTYKQIFPLTRLRWFNSLLEHSYFMLFGEIALVLLLWSRLDLKRFIRSLFAFYAIGMLGFVLVPAVGPCIYFPDSISAELPPTSITHRAMQGMRLEYEAVLQSSRNLSGYGYFIALPSLHVMVVCLLQFYLHPCPTLFWLFLPINILIALSTVFLGYHYAVDAFIAAALAGIWISLIEKKRGLRQFEAATAEPSAVSVA